jgi:hypothetical protein
MEDGEEWARMGEQLARMGEEVARVREQAPGAQDVHALALNV